MTIEPQDQRVDPDDWDLVVRDTDGPQLVVAGPGTGKTQFLVERARHLIADRQVPAAGILVLTFSRRAAGDLRSRIENATQGTSTGVAASTFHSFAYRLLETYASDVLGWEVMPSLLTGPEQVALVAELLTSEPEEHWPVGFRGMLTTHTFADEVTDFILRSQESLLDDEALADRVAARADWKGLSGFRRRYLDELKARHRIDYGTLQAQAVRVLADDDVQARIAEQYRYVLVDEYQDTTAAQARFLELLTSRHRNITAAADPYQSVYSFRGAELTNVADFPSQFSDARGNPARRLVLSTSFRVPETILRAAERITSGGDLPGAAGPVLPAPHEGVVEAFVFNQQSEEAEWIATEAQRLHLSSGVAYREIAVLMRSKRRFLPELSRALERRRIPHDSPDTRLVDHPAVRLVFDCAFAAAFDGVAPGTGTGVDTDRAVRRMLLGAAFGVPLGLERELLRERRRTDRPWSELLAESIPETRALAGLLADPNWACEIPAVDGFWHLWTTLPEFAVMVANPALGDFRQAWTSLAQALTRQKERDPGVTLVEYLRLADLDDFEATPLLSYRDSDEDRLTLTTLHQAKGLQFEVVFLADAVEGVFPDLRRSRSLLQPRLLSAQQSDRPTEAAQFRLQEEMRLAYTAMTRASSRVVWTATKAGIDEIERRPSRFLHAVVPTERISGPPVDLDRTPLTYLEAEAYLRRILTDPMAGQAARLAAVKVLADRPNPGLRPASEFAGLRLRGRDDGLIDDDLALSPSQATSYHECPRRYAFERRLGIGQSFGHYATFGTLIHDVLEYAEKRALSEGRDRSTLDDALSHLDTLWPEFEFDGGARRQAWRRRAETLLGDLYASWIRPEAHAVFLERDLELEIDGIRWRGRADRIESQAEGKLRVVDYKTSKTAPPAADAARSIQLAFYLAAAQADPEVAEKGDPTEAEFWYPLASRKTKWIAFEPAHLEETLATMRDIATGIKQEDWTPRFGHHCKRCAVRLVCPLWPEGQEAFTR